MKLVLFDIDGTLLVTGGASSRCIRRAAAAVLGRSVDNMKITVGTLDPEIFLELAGKKRVTDDLVRTYRELYAAELQRELVRCAADVRALPGGRELVDVLGRSPRVCVGILSGNWREIGEMKLVAAGYDLSRFPVRAFADNGTRRPELVDAALNQACAAVGQPCSPQELILVGDTPRDVEAARASGCRIAAVATGQYSLAELAALDPDVALADLTDPSGLHALITRISCQP